MSGPRSLQHQIKFATGLINLNLIARPSARSLEHVLLECDVPGSATSVETDRETLEAQISRVAKAKLVTSTGRWRRPTARDEGEAYSFYEPRVWI